jgi:hypothetical protein
VEAEDEPLLVGGDAAALQARVQVVHPPEAAALAGAPETCISTTAEKRRRRGEEERDWLMEFPELRFDRSPATAQT